MRSVLHNDQIKAKILLLLTMSLLLCGVGYAQTQNNPLLSSSDAIQDTLNVSVKKNPILFALKTNSFSDLFAIPNIGAEVDVYKGITVEVSYYNSWLRNKAHTRYYRFEGFEAEVCYYKDAVSFKGHHIGVYGQMMTWDFTFRKRGYLAERWVYGGGISYGYTMPIIKNLNVDFEIGLGYLGGRMHQYVPENGLRVWKSVEPLHWVGPTKLEVTIQWIIDFNEWRMKGE